MADSDSSPTETAPALAGNTEPPRGWLGRLKAFAEAHPTLATFLFLAPCMVVILLLSMQSVPLEPQQRLAMVLATVGLAGACAWIIGWE